MIKAVFCNIEPSTILYVSNEPDLLLRTEGMYAPSRKYVLIVLGEFRGGLYCFTVLVPPSSPTYVPQCDSPDSLAPQGICWDEFKSSLLSST